MTNSDLKLTGTRRHGLRALLAAVVIGSAALATAGVVEARGMFGGEALDPVERNHRIEYGVNRALSKVDATDEQKKKITAIVQSASTDLRSLRQKRMDTRKAMREAMEAPTIDRAKLEKLRGEQMQVADAASKRFVQAMTDAGEVLTADQRQKFFKNLEEHRGLRR